MGSVVSYLQVFLVGGIVCFLGQLLINFTRVTSAKILVIFLLLGVALEAFGLFDPIKEFGGAGITVPIVGFGSVLAKGAIKGAEVGLLEAVTGGMAAASAGLTSSIVFGFIFAIIFKTHSKIM